MKLIFDFFLNNENFEEKKCTVTFFVQQKEIDKIHNGKAEKYSFLVVYLVTFHYLFEVRLFFLKIVLLFLSMNN